MTTNIKAIKKPLEFIQATFLSIFLPQGVPLRYIRQKHPNVPPPLARRPSGRVSVEA